MIKKATAKEMYQRLKECKEMIDDNSPTWQIVEFFQEKYKVTSATVYNYIKAVKAE